MTSQLKARVKRSKYAHLITEELLREGESQEWVSRYGGRGLGCELLPDERRITSQAFGDLVIDILRHRQTKLV